MRLRELLPEDLYVAIRRHLVEQGNAASAGWEAGSAEEDTLTGHLGAKLQTEGWMSGPSGWHWRVAYKKFRGRGKGAFEKRSGADGIFQIEISSTSSPEHLFKAVVFQAKKGHIRPNKELHSQVGRMESLAESGSAVVSYEAAGYRAMAGREYLQQYPKLLVPHDASSQLGNYLGNRFLACTSGVLGMYFDAVRQVLVIPQPDGSTKTIQVELGSRTSIDIVRHS